GLTGGRRRPRRIPDLGDVPAARARGARDRRSGQLLLVPALASGWGRGVATARGQRRGTARAGGGSRTRRREVRPPAYPSEYQRPPGESHRTSRTLPFVSHSQG